MTSQMWKELLVIIARRVNTALERDSGKASFATHKPNRAIVDPRAPAKRKLDEEDCDVPEKRHRSVLCEHDRNVPD
ncbi:hypothetical protein AAVH_41849, partial [Aphelenchoides avenae]